MKNILIFLFVLLPFISFSQISDDFEDGNISDWTQSVAGHWATSDSLPISGLYSLHQNFLTNLTANYQDKISTSIGSIDVSEGTTTWQLNIRYDNTKPSGTNKWNVFLMADQDYNQMPSGLINGYVIGVNFGSLSDDILKLNKVTNGSGSNVISTSFVWNTSGTIGIKVTRTSFGVWEVFVDNDGGFDNLLSVGSATDNTYKNFSFFGIVYDYTKTYCRKFWLDDFTIVGPPDITAPKLIGLESNSPTNLKLSFSEKLDITSSQTLLNYLINNSIGNPNSAILDGTKKNIDLNFSSNFLENTNYILNITNIEDEATNKIKDTSVSFIWKNIIVSSIKVNSATSVDVSFSKTLDQITAETLLNYTVDNSIGSPISATLDAVNKKLVHLNFSNAIQVNQNYSLNVQNIKDIYGNVIISGNYSFSYNAVQQFDVVFNEFMIDVSPAPVALPANKYIELYNSSDFDIDLTDWTLQIGTNSPKTFPALIINSHGFVIVCASDVQSTFSQFGKVAPILTESQLTSTIGKKVILKTNNGEIINELTYSPDWYFDSNKESGGWSLERIDPLNICNQEQNWHASKNYIGGTPGSINSVFANNPDNISPKLISYTKIASTDINLYFSEVLENTIATDITSYILNSNVNPSSVILDNNDNSVVHLKFLSHFNFGENTLKVTNIKDYCDNVIPDTIINFSYSLIHPLAILPMSNNQLKIYFSEPVSVSSSQNTNNYSVDGEIDNPSIAIRDYLDTSVVHLTFDSNFEEDKEYNIIFKDITDLNGNKLATESFKFIYHITKYNDLVINELLYNPFPYGADFVELFNRTNYSIDLQKIRIAKRDDFGNLTSFYNLSNKLSIIEPDSFVVITVDTLNIKNTYKCGNKFLQLSTLPSYSDDKGIVVIIDEKDTIIDEFIYNDDMQFPLLSTSEGVSLERIDYNQPTNNIQNWHSAAENIGFATPGLLNSQYRNINLDSTIGTITINEQVFSPDNDGYNDQLYINYHFEKSGYVAIISIYDKNGILIKNLVENELLGINGMWIWDGLDNNNLKSKIGIYAIVIKIFDLNGSVKVFKLTAVLAGKR